MYIPLDQIYNYLGGLIAPNTIIYRFSRHGSKKVHDLSLLKYPTIRWIDCGQEPPPVIIMYDQEPLDFDFYNPTYLRENLPSWLTNNNLHAGQFFAGSVDIQKFWCESNLGFICSACYSWTLHDKNIIVHSELRSKETDKYQAIGLEPVYWWSHAVIAQDWYRYAQHDPYLKSLPKLYDLDFNIYNRAWSGTREYRLKFTDLIIDNELVSASNIKFNPTDNNINYQQHQFQNSKFKPNNKLEQLPPNLSDSASSADYSSADYAQCWFDIVLETLFDDTRLHLTEKILRPIACGKPFILAATQGSLQYLRDYGFHTFDGIIDESYDLESDPIKRLEAIIAVMKQIHAWSPEQKLSAAIKITAVTRHNQQLFFSDRFTNHVLQEFKTNMTRAEKICSENVNGAQWIKLRKMIARVPDLKEFMLAHARPYVIECFKKLRLRNNKS